MKRKKETAIKGIEKWVKKNCKGKQPDDELIHHFIVAEIILAFMQETNP